MNLKGINEKNSNELKLASKRLSDLYKLENNIERSEFYSKHLDNKPDNIKI